jgi:glutathione synthase/RimK-type ligase-like ATP-grasp enzyme
MADMSLLGIYREQIFSPGKVQEDAAILDATLAELSHLKMEVRTLQGEDLDDLFPRPDYVLSMAQSERALTILEDWQKRGVEVINSVQSVRNCYRKPLMSILAEAGIPMPPSQMVPLEKLERRTSLGSNGRYWLKRGDVHAIQTSDVVKVASEEDLVKALDHFHNQKIEDVLIQEHVEGQVIKFYGVGFGEYFCAFDSSSGEKVTSGIGELSPVVHQAVEAVGLEIYGGDAILTQEGGVILIDLNDWPSFSRCCRPAAKSIAKYIISRVVSYEFCVAG